MTAAWSALDKNGRNVMPDNAYFNIFIKIISTHNLVANYMRNWFVVKIPRGGRCYVISLKFRPYKYILNFLNHFLFDNGHHRSGLIRKLYNLEYSLNTKTVTFLFIWLDIWNTMQWRTYRQKLGVNFKGGLVYRSNS